jgi:hypothetical protein
MVKLMDIQCGVKFISGRNKLILTTPSLLWREGVGSLVTKGKEGDVRNERYFSQ